MATATNISGASLAWHSAPRHQIGLALLFSLQP
jgi:hypothetical protein